MSASRFALWRYGANDPDNDIECLGQFEINDGDTLALSCHDTYDGAALTITDKKIVLDYVNSKGETITETLFELEGSVP